MTEEAKSFLSVIVCHKDNPKFEFLRNSIASNIGMVGIEIIPVIGAESIAKGYNEGASRAKTPYLAFVHSDVEWTSSRAMTLGLLSRMKAPDTGFIGIAGSRVIREDAMWWQAQKDMLSGACLHAENGQMWMTSFGKYGPVAVLDGVFMVVRQDVFGRLGGFDESLPGWDYYDIDITLRATLAGYMNHTYPLHVLHHSLGNRVFTDPGFKENRKRFMEKWGEVLPVSV